MTRGISYVNEVRTTSLILDGMKQQEFKQLIEKNGEEIIFKHSA